MKRLFTCLQIAFFLSLALPATGRSQTAPGWVDGFAMAGGRTSIGGIARDGSGNIYVAGSFSDVSPLRLGAVTLNKIGLTDIFVAKLDSAGNVQWARNFGGTGAYTLGTAVAVDGAGRVVVGGTFLNGDLTTPPLPRIGVGDLVALALDPDGTLSWYKNFGGSGAIINPPKMAARPAGGVCLASQFSGGNIRAPAPALAALALIGRQDGLLICTAADGSATLAKNLGGVGAGVTVNGTAIDGTDNVYLVGAADADLTVPALSVPAYGGLAVKVNAASGGIAWAKIFPDTVLSAVSAVSPASVRVGGIMYANQSNPALTRIGSSDALILALDPAGGGAQWGRNFGGGAANISALTQDAGGNIFALGGFSVGNMTSPPLSRRGNDDAFVVKLDGSGTLSWFQNYGGPGAYILPRWIETDGSGNVYVAGNYYGAGLTVPALALTGASDGFVFWQATGTAAVPTPQSGFYYTPGSGGRGFSIELNGTSSAFVGAFTYTAAGSDVWYAGTCVQTVSAATGTVGCSGQFNEFGGGTTFADLGVAATATTVTGAVARFQIVWTTAADAVITLTPADGSAVASYALTRFPIDGSSIAAAPSWWVPQTGWWHNADYGGAGWFIEAQNARNSAGTTVSDAFLVGYAYGGSGGSGKANWWSGRATLMQSGGGATAGAAMLENQNGPTLTGGGGGLSLLAGHGAIGLQCTSTTACTLALPNGRSLPIARFKAF